MQTAKSAITPKEGNYWARIKMEQSNAEITNKI